MSKTPQCSLATQTALVKWPVKASCVTLMAVLIMVFLGVWQLDRMEQKQHRLDSIAQKDSSAPMHPLQVAQQWQDIRDVPVQFSGTLDTTRVMFIDNQIYNGKTGFDVIVPVLTHGQSVLVNMGWIAANSARGTFPDVALPHGEIRINGVITQPGHNPLVQETQTQFNQFPLLLQQVDIALLNQYWPTAQRQPLPNMVVERLSSTPQTNQFIANWQPVVMSPQKHLGYAIQWFGLAIAAVVIFIVVLVRRSK